MREEDREKFKKLAEKRVNTAIKTMKLIGNLANKSNYYYTDADVKKIFRALDQAVGECKSRFDAASKNQDPNTFTLD